MGAHGKEERLGRYQDQRGLSSFQGKEQKEEKEEEMINFTLFHYINHFFMEFIELNRIEGNLIG